MEFSVHRPSPPNTYSYVQEESLGSTRKFIEIDRGKRVSPAHVQQVFMPVMSQKKWYIRFLGTVLWQEDKLYLKNAFMTE